MTSDAETVQRGVTCRGSYVLGTACGRCWRCDEERGKLAAPLAADGDRPETVTENPKSWIAWKREAEAAESRLTHLEEALKTLIDKWRFREANQALRDGYPETAVTLQSCANEVEASLTSRGSE